MRKWLVMVEVTTVDEASAKDVEGYFDDALSEHGDRVMEDNGYSWDATAGWTGNAQAVRM